MQLNQAIITDLIRRMDQGHFSDVIAEAERLIAQFPRVAGLHEIRGMAHARAGDSEPAEKAFRRALKLMPNLASARFNLGILLVNQQKWRQAAECLQHRLKLQPDNIGARYQLGIALFRQQRMESAKACFEWVVAEAPQTVDAHFYLGLIARQNDDPATALGHFGDVLSHKRDHFEALFNMGNIHRDLFHPDKAQACFEEALAVRPKHVNTMINLANVEMGRHDMPAAIAWLDKALETEPDNTNAAFSKSLPHFMMGDLERGFAAAELRFEKSDPVMRLYSGDEAAWDGRRLGGDDLLVIHAEQGLGDTIMMIRFLALVDLPRNQVVVLVPSKLLELLAGSFSGWSFQPLEKHRSGWPGATARCSLMSLPHVLKAQWRVPPSAEGYLAAPVHAVETWKQVFPDATPPRVGLVWRGSDDHKENHLRSIGIADLLSALVPGPDYISLQWDLTKAEERAFASRSDLEIRIERPGDFADTAGAVMHLDHLVCVDTSIAHLGGALGIQTSIFLHYLPDWRWGLGTDSSNWYESVSLFRQAGPGDWDGPLRAIGDRMKALL